MLRLKERGEHSITPLTPPESWNWDQRLFNNSNDKIWISTLETEYSIMRLTLTESWDWDQINNSNNKIWSSTLRSKAFNNAIDTTWFMRLRSKAIQWQHLNLNIEIKGKRTLFNITVDTTWIVRLRSKETGHFQNIRSWHYLIYDTAFTCFSIRYTCSCTCIYMNMNMYNYIIILHVYYKNMYVQVITCFPDQSVTGLRMQGGRVKKQPRNRGRAAKTSWW